MQLISKYNKGIRYLLCVSHLFSKYAWVVPLKDKKEFTIVSACQKFLKECNRKPNKMWVDQGSEFCNSHFKKWLKGNDIERFIRTLKNKICKHMTAVSKMFILMF